MTQLRAMIRLGLSICAAATAVPAIAAVECAQFFAGGSAPQIVEEAMAGRGPIFCHTFYAVAYSTERRDPIWAAELLTREMAEASDRFGRVKSTFKKQKGLTADQQGAHKDYSNQPYYDRGHMAPANDAPDVPSQKDTFVVTNIVPQTKKLNETLWQYLEASVHELAAVDGQVFVVTGPAFDPAAPPVLLAGRIAIPTSTWKAVYSPARQIAVAYVATNTAPPVCRMISIMELRQITGVDPFPSVGEQLKAAIPNFQPPAGQHTTSGGAAQPVPRPDCR